MASAGYVTYDPATRKFTLPPEHVPVLAQENGPFFFGGIYQMLSGMLGPLDQIAQCFKQGGGVSQAAYNDNMWDGLERFTAGWESSTRPASISARRAGPSTGRSSEPSMHFARSFCAAVR